jgi:hypothetical protein
MHSTSLPETNHLRIVKPIHMTNLVAFVLIILLGLAHSILGELLIFRHLRKDGRWIDPGLKGLRTQQVRVLWSTWHLVSLLGFSVATIVLIIGPNFPVASFQVDTAIAQILTLTFGVASIFWLAGTKGRHPAWIVFIIISVVIYLSQASVVK